MKKEDRKGRRPATRAAGTGLRLVAVLLVLLVANTAVAQRRQDKRPRVGLVLGGGGAKGAAEVGALKVIEQSGVTIDYIAGTSIGAIIGGLYACGYRSAQLDSLFRSQNWNHLLADRNGDFDKRPLAKHGGTTFLFGYPVGKKHDKDGGGRRGIMRGDSIVALLTEMTRRPDSISFDRLPIPFRCVAVDMNSLSEHVFASGVLAKAMRASMSIPVAFKTVEKDSMELVDGGLLNNLPVDVVKAMGADIVIAIDLTQNHRPPTGKVFKRKKHPLAQLIEWAKKRPDLVKYHQNLKLADIYINPDLEGFDAASFDNEKIGEMIRRGETAAGMKRGELDALATRLRSAGKASRPSRRR